MTLEQATAASLAVAAASLPANRKSTGGKKKNNRRRSSAKFLRLSGRFDGDEEDDENAAPSSDKLSEMYTTAIKMSAENKINSNNTWGLQLIENMDKIIGGPPPATQRSKFGMAKGKNKGGADDEQEMELVNFQRASCTLDASVKIYSYRVDDVHLSSYKMLANINRTEVDDNDDDESVLDEKVSKAR